MQRPSDSATDRAAGWWTGVAGTAHPRSPRLIILAGDTEHQHSRLPEDFAERWLSDVPGTRTGRTAASLGVPVAIWNGDPGCLDGADLILLGDVGRGLTTTAAIAACRSLSLEPQLTVGWGSGIDDVQWMHKTLAVRDALHGPEQPEPLIAAGAELLERCAERDIPVLLDGVVSAACADTATILPALAAPVRSTEPAQDRLLQRLGLSCWIEGLPAGEGIGALWGLLLIRLGGAGGPADQV